MLCLGFPSMRVSSKNKGSKRRQAEAVSPFMTYPEKSHSVTSAVVTSPGISKGKEPFSRTSVKITLLRRTHGIRQIVMAIFGKYNLSYLLYKEQIILFGIIVKIK